MKEKYQVILKLIIIFVTLIALLVFKYIPEYKNSKGSSDFYIDINKYTDIVEFKINNEVNFALVTTKNVISNILFFDQQAMCLYNKNIENQSIKDGTKKIIELLIENDYLKQQYNLTFTKYKGTSYEGIKQNTLSAISEFGINVVVKEEQTTIKEKAKTYGYVEMDEEEALSKIQLISKELVRQYKNDFSNSGIINPPTISEDQSRDLADNIYKKLEQYVRQNNIKEQAKNNQTLNITTVPADTNGTIFPSSESWYYVQSGRVYAYINIKQEDISYSYCYQGSIDEYKKGQC